MSERQRSTPKVRGDLPGGRDRMSLINRMLNDLDERRAVGAELGGASRDIRPLPAVDRAMSPWAVAGIVVPFLVVAGISVWMMSGSGGAPLPDSSALSDVQFVSQAKEQPDALSAPVAPGAVSSALPETLPVEVPPPPEFYPAKISVRDEERPQPIRVASDPPVHSPAGNVVTPGLRLSSRLTRLPAPSGRSAPAPVNEVRNSPQANAVSAQGGNPGTIDKQVVVSSPRERAERLYGAALGLLAQGRSEEGIVSMQAALREDAAHFAARQWLIKYYIDSRLFDAAKVVLREGLSVLPTQTSWSLLLSRLQADSGDNAGALQTLEAALPSSVGTSGEAELRGALGAILQRLLRYSEAELHFGTATQLDPGQGRWWLGLGLVSEAQGMMDKARSAFQRAVDAKTLSPELLSFVEQKLK